MIAVSEEIRGELIFLLISFALGEGLVMLYDMFRIFRKVVPHGVLWTAVEDVLYWMMAALLIFGMIFQKNDGLIRGFSLGGIVLGMLFFNHFVSGFSVRGISKILNKVLGICKKGLKKITRAVKIGLCKLKVGE